MAGNLPRCRKPFLAIHPRGPHAGRVAFEQRCDARIMKSATAVGRTGIDGWSAKSCWKAGRDKPSLRWRGIARTSKNPQKIGDPTHFAKPARCARIARIMAESDTHKMWNPKIFSSEFLGISQFVCRRCAGRARPAAQRRELRRALGLLSARWWQGVRRAIAWRTIATVVKRKLPVTFRH